MELFEYQKDGTNFLVSQKRALLADDMGLGKSAQAVSAVKHLGAKNVLVICPASLRLNWQQEFIKFGVDGPFDFLSSQNRDPKAGVIQIASYDFIAKHAYYFVTGPVKYDVIIMDEAHKLKNPDARRTRAMYGNKCHGGGVVRLGEHVYPLTGTPTPNYPHEAWPMLRALFPEGLLHGGRYLSYEDFQSRYCTFNAEGKINGGQNLAELKQRLKPFFLRRYKKDVMKDLPPKIITECLLVDKALRAQINALAEDDEQEIIAAFEAEDLHKAMTKPSIAEILHQTGLLKVKPVADLAAGELDQTEEKLVLFAWHRDVIEGLQERLSKYGAVKLYGGMTDKAKNEAVRAFQEDAETRVFVGQISSAGVGLTLTAASNLWMVESSWTPTDNSQAIDRCHRIGQRSSVLAKFISVAGSMDQKVQAIAKRKAETIRQVF